MTWRVESSTDCGGGRISQPEIMSASSNSEKVNELGEPGGGVKGDGAETVAMVLR